MDLDTAERAIMSRYHEKCRLAGGPKPGYNMRKAAILWVRDEHPAADFEKGLAGLVEKGLLKSNEAGDRYVLTAAGAERLSADFGP